MRNKNRLLLSLLIMIGLTACNPNFNDSSEDKPSVDPSVVSSEDSSSQGSTEPTSESEDPSTSESESESESGSDSSESSSSSEEPPAQKTIQEICDEMNEYIKGQTYFDVFEIKDDLYSQGYTEITTGKDGKYFGYDETLNKVAIREGNNVIYPSGGNVNTFISYRSVSVSNIDTLKSAITAQSTNDSEYGVISLSNNLTLSTTTIQVSGTRPIEINLNGKTIDSTLVNSPVIKVDNNDATKPTVAITNGKIQTPDLDGYDLSKSPTCIKNSNATKLRLTDVTLNNRAERGYSYIDLKSSGVSSSVKINHSVVSSKIVALCIENNTNIIDGNTINGVVVINGGDSRITNNRVDASNVQKGLDQEADRLITNDELYSLCKETYVQKDVTPYVAYKDSYMLTTTDAILIYDRRSANSSYDSPVVLIENNTLICKASEGSNPTPYGYAVRYMDLNFDPAKATNSLTAEDIIIGRNTSPYISNWETGSLNAPGGVIYQDLD